MSGSHLCIPRIETVIQNRIIMLCLPVPTLLYLWEIYIFPVSICPFCCRELQYVDWSWEDINRSQTHECGYWDWGRAIPRKGIHKCDFPCSVVQKCSVAAQVIFGVRFPKLVWAPCAQLYTHWLRPLQHPASLAFGLRRYWSAKIDDIFLWPLE